MQGRTYTGHDIYGTAIDFSASGTIKLYAPADGVISEMVAHHPPSYNTYPVVDNGNYIQITTSEGLRIIMAHMSSIDSTIVSKGIGGTVHKGEFLGYMGNTGCSTGQHLHFEVRPHVDSIFGYSINYILSNSLTGSISNGDVGIQALSIPENLRWNVNEYEEKNNGWVSWTRVINCNDTYNIVLYRDGVETVSVSTMRYGNTGFRFVKIEDKNKVFVEKSTLDQAIRNDIEHL